MISTRRACLSRSFRSAIRFVDEVLPIDRKYSAATFLFGRKIESFIGLMLSYLAMLVILEWINGILDAVPLCVAALMAVAIIVIGCFYLVSPERISGTFGLRQPAPDADTRAWL